MENVKRLIAAIEEKREELIEASKECYKNTMDGSCFQGWEVGVRINVDGDIDSFYRGSSDTTFEEINMEAIAVITYKVDNETDVEELTEDHLQEEEIIGFKKFLLENEYIENEEEWHTELNHDRVEEFDEAITQRVENEWIGFTVDNNYYEYGKEKLEKTIEFLEEMGLGYYEEI